MKDDGDACADAYMLTAGAPLCVPTCSITCLDPLTPRCDATPRRCMTMHAPRLVTPVQAPYVQRYVGPNECKYECLFSIADVSRYPVTTGQSARITMDYMLSYIRFRATQVDSALLSL